MTALAIESLSAGYGAAPVVSGVSMEIAEGGWLAIIGPNGSGKSTLLKSIVGVVRSQGEIRLDGTSAARLSAQQRARAIGYAPQTPVLPDGLTVAEYVLLGRTPHLGVLARERPADLAVVDRVLGRLDLAELAGRPLRTLSGGERQRTVLARVLAQQASLLLLDEPTTGLDIGHAQALLGLVDRLRREDGTTVVTTLHDLTLAAQYADQLLLLTNGTVAAAGTPEQVLTRQVVARHYAAHVEVLRTAEGYPVIAPARPDGRPGG